MRLEFHPEARAELAAAARAYREESPGLGPAFVEATRRAAARLVEYPYLGAVLRGEFRRQLVRRFPYALIYRVEPDRIYIVAVMHLRRRPGYWRRRL